MASVAPKQTITAANASEFAALQAYLDDLGYTVGGASATRVDDGDALTVTLTYPGWTLTV